VTKRPFRLMPVITKECPACGRAFLVSAKHPNQQSCSRECVYVSRPKRERYVWTEAMDSVVRNGYKRGDDARVIAARLGITLFSVSNQARLLGLTHRRYSRTLEQRFWDYVSCEPNSGCWLWEGSRDRKGYGQLRISHSGPRSLRYATHISLELDGRPVPAGMLACHTCDIPSCVNPDHLFIGTPLQNTADMIAKGRERFAP